MHWQVVLYLRTGMDSDNRAELNAIRARFLARAGPGRAGPGRAGPGWEARLAAVHVIRTSVRVSCLGFRV